MRTKPKSATFFCEDYQKDFVESKGVDDLWKSTYHGSSVGATLDSVLEDQVDGLV
jgi:hypothetical protein